MWSRVTWSRAKWLGAMLSGPFVCVRYEWRLVMAGDAQFDVLTAEDGSGPARGKVGKFCQWVFMSLGHAAVSIYPRVSVPYQWNVTLYPNIRLRLGFKLSLFCTKVIHNKLMATASRQ